MKHGRMVVLAGAAAAVVCVVLAGCSAQLPFGNPLEGLFNTSPSVAEARLERQQAREAKLSASDLVSEGVLTVGLQTDSVTAPLCIVDGDSVRGMDVDVASAIADELGLFVRFVQVSGVAQPLAAGTCDVVMDASADHAGGAAVVGGYYESAASFFHRGPEGAVEVAALDGATVGLQQGSISEGVLHQTGLVMTERSYSNLNEAFDALNNGLVDYVLCDTYPGAYLAAAYDDITFAGSLNAPVLLGVAVAVDKVATQEAVQQALDTISSNGVMSIIRSSWVGGMPSITASDEIRDVPGAVASTSVEGVVEATVQSAQDGSTAGSNAVQL